MNWICIETDGMPNDLGYALPVRCFVCNPDTDWAGVAQCDRNGWFDVHPAMDPRDGNITHWVEIELPPNLGIRWPRDWGKVCTFFDNNGAGCGHVERLTGFNGDGGARRWYDESGVGWEQVRLATPEEAGDMVALTVPEEVRG